MTTENPRRMWKLAGIVLPALITGGFSYLKAKTEAKEQGQASYETLKKAIDDMQAARKEAEERAAKLEQEVDEQAEHIKVLEAPKVPSRPAFPSPPATPSVAGMGAMGGANFSRARPPHKMREPVELPAKLEDVVEQYKAKK